jgi:hypothetical protein
MDWSDIVTRYVLPPILGGVAGLFSPWANWWIEKSRQRLQRRRELVTGWRMKLIPMLKENGEGESWTDQRGKLMASPYYASLRPHLLPEFAERLQKRRQMTVGDDFPISGLIEEIGRIERKWKLV